MFISSTSETSNRGHMFKFFLPCCRLTATRFSFCQRVDIEWNILPAKAVNQTTVNGCTDIIHSIFRKMRGYA